MRSFKLRGLVISLGVSLLVGCENTITNGPPSPSSTSSIEIPKADPGDGAGAQKGPRRPGAGKKAASGATPAVPD